MERRRQKQGEEEKGKEEKFRSDAMDREDSEMMDTETAASGTNQNDVVKDLLSLARQLINEGKPSQALQTVLPPHIQFTNSFFFHLSSFPISLISSFTSFRKCFPMFDGSILFLSSERRFLFNASDF